MSPPTLMKLKERAQYFKAERQQLHALQLSPLPFFLLTRIERDLCWLRKHCVERRKAEAKKGVVTCL